MGSSEIILTAIIGVIIWAAILRSVITSASRSKKIELELKKQTDLLGKIAQKQGVENNEIDAILNQVLG